MMLAVLLCQLPAGDGCEEQGTEIMSPLALVPKRFGKAGACGSG